jgi:hypothetical protein
MDTKYSTPQCKDIAVCMCFFSPAGFQKPKQNFLYIKSLLDKAKIPTFTAECVIGNQVPLISNPTIQVRSNSCLFYKEQLYNLLVPKIPQQYTKLIFIDADIIFNKRDWVDQISRSLNIYDVVQPFETAIWMGSYYGITLRNVNSFFFGILTNVKNDELFNYHSGFSFAMTRTFLTKIGGFFDKCIVGGGDTSFCNLFPRIEPQYTYTKLIHLEYSKWFKNAMLVPKKFTYLPMTVYHLYHGTIENRHYDSRHKLLDSVESWDDAIYTNEDGIYELKHKDMNDIMKMYFVLRKEDDVPYFKFKLVKDR